MLAETYYVRVEGAHKGRLTGLYTVAVRFTPAGGGDAVSEHGNTRAAATRVGLNSETRGRTDTAGYLGAGEGPWLSQNDNDGADVNFRAVWQVTAGTYYVAVVGRNNRTATGLYTLAVRFTGADAEVEEHGNTRTAATEVEVNSEAAGRLERAGDVDYFRVAVPGVGTLTVGTGGATDTMGYVGGTGGGARRPGRTRCG